MPPTSSTPPAPPHAHHDLNYTTPAESIAKCMAIAEAVTATSTAAAISLMNIADTGFNLSLP